MRARLGAAHLQKQIIDITGISEGVRQERSRGDSEGVVTKEMPATKRWPETEEVRISAQADVWYDRIGCLAISAQANRLIADGAEVASNSAARDVDGIMKLRVEFSRIAFVTDICVDICRCRD
jgi:hypothetical protein